MKLEDYINGDENTAQLQEGLIHHWHRLRFSFFCMNKIYMPSKHLLAIKILTSCALSLTKHQFLHEKKHIMKTCQFIYKCRLKYLASTTGISNSQRQFCSKKDHHNHKYCRLHMLFWVLEMFDFLPAYGDDSSLSALTFIPPVILQ